MAWFRVRLTEEEQRVVNEERCCHPNLRIRERCSCFGCCTPGSRVSMRPRLSESVGRPSSDTWPRFGRGLGRLAAVESQSPVSEMAAIAS